MSAAARCGGAPAGVRAWSPRRWASLTRQCSGFAAPWLLAPPPGATGAVRRYEWPCPGNFLHIDTKRHARLIEPGHAVTGKRTYGSRRAGWEFVHTIVDDCSRLAYAEIHDEKARTVTEFTRRALDWFLERGVVAERLLSHNAWVYVKTKGLAQLLGDRIV